MNLCEDGHDEVCYDGKSCPACKALEELAQARERIDDLELQVEDQKEEIEALEAADDDA